MQTPYVFLFIKQFCNKSANIVFQIWICICLFVLASGFEKTSATDREELQLCEIISRTPNYSKYKLYNKANCLAHVKTFGNLSCLRNDDNQVTKNFKLLKQISIFLILANHLTVLKFELQTKNNACNLSLNRTQHKCLKHKKVCRLDLEHLPNSFFKNFEFKKNFKM